jgi:hypothetical protein
MNIGDIAERLIEAAEIARYSYDPVGPKKLKAQALPYMHSTADKNGWGSERLAEERKEFWQSLSRSPTARQVSEAEEAFSWLALVSDEGQRSALSAWVDCHVVGRRFFKDWCFANGIHPETGRRRKDRALFAILGHLVRKPLVKNENDDFGLLLGDPEIDYFADKIRDRVKKDGISAWWQDGAFQPIIAGAEHDFSWADKRNEQRRQRRAAMLKKQAA